MIAFCKENGIKGYSGKKKGDILALIGDAAAAKGAGAGAGAASAAKAAAKTAAKATPVSPKLARLNYIGSKYQLLEWLTANIQEKTGWPSFKDKKVADLFAGTGIVSYHFRQVGAHVVSNDAELYSSIIAYAFTRSTYNETCRKWLEQLQAECDAAKAASSTPLSPGYITTYYSPHASNERKFFTVENALRIDYVRARIEALRDTLGHEDTQFLLASLLVSADAVSNVPAVYGCFLQNFKDKAKKPFRLVPVHTHTTPATHLSVSMHSDVLSPTLLRSIEADVVYLDPPYNERQYSKNYFPLNMIAKTPTELLAEPPLKGKTGIPVGCFLSPFCKKGATVEAAFETLFKDLKAEWIFLSYNSESIVSKEKMLELMGKHGTASVIEREYKRFKSYEYNKDVPIQEYLFCLHKAPGLTATGGT